MRDFNPFQGWRLTFFQGIMIAVFVIFAFRMYDLQVIQYDTWRAQADENRFSELPIASDRGVIYDRYGQSLARNAAAFLVEITPAELPGELSARYAIYNRLSALVDVPPTISAELVNGERIRSIERIVNEGESVRPFTPIAVAVDIDNHAAMRILEEGIELPGVTVRNVAVREYPTGSITSHIVGYMGPIGPDEAERLRELGYDPAFDRVGYDGVEAYLETELSGRRGSRLREVDVAGEVLNEISYTPPVAGNSVRLTLDVELQEAAQQALIEQLDILRQLNINSETGVVIAMDPRTGEILAMVSYPSYDNSRFARAIDGEYYLEVLNDPLTPLVNHSIGSLYAPGSAWKLITASAVLEEDVIEPNTTLFDGGSLVVQNRYAEFDPLSSQRFVCHFAPGHGNLNIVGAIAQSCNVYFYQVGGGNPEVSESRLRPGGLGIDNLIRYATSLGVGSELGVELPGEIAGRMPDRNWKRVNYGENWSTGDTYNAAFGQGYITVTPLQLIASVQGIIMGTLYQPTLVREYINQEGNAIAPFEPVVARTLSLDQANEDGTITLRLLEDQFIRGNDSLSCTCEPDSDFYNPGRCNPEQYRAEVDIDESEVVADIRTYRVFVPAGYNFNGGICGRTPPFSNYTPAFLSEANLEIVRTGMRQAVEVGTANANLGDISLVRPDGTPVLIAGKTGTAEYCDDIAFSRGLCAFGAWPAHAWFTAYTSYGDPELVVVAFVYNGDEGSRFALPIVAKVMEAYYRLQAERANPVLDTPSDDGTLAQISTPVVPASQTTLPEGTVPDTAATTEVTAP
jgi:penicillin-binding protein 2